MQPRGTKLRGKSLCATWIAPAALALAAGLTSGQAFAQVEVQNLANGNFDTGVADPWWTGGSATTQVVDGRLCIDVADGTVNPWDAMLGQSGVQIEAGELYRFQFDVSADQPVTFSTTVQLAQEPYTSPLAQQIQADLEPQTYSFEFTSAEAIESGQVTFQLGGAAQGFTVCLDNISLVGGKGYVPDLGPNVRVNQLGYVPFGPKRATVVTDATTPQAWQLKREDGTVALQGQTEIFGLDAPSGDMVHTIDFSHYHREGTGYTLSVGGVASYPFAISRRLYDQLRYDAVQFFYPQRSGIEILAQYAGEAYARPAGHLGVAPNQGDTSVPCIDATCDYSLDVSGGWYDAGDQGKYVVNGGISVWQLLNTYERAFPFGSWKLRDGTQQIPEQNNRIPDILDEARWEMEFLLKMQVPDGKPNAGMAFHRIHDAAWTGFPTMPALDPQPRYLHPPSTAATLNLAAVAAQSARVFWRWDWGFAMKCLFAAEKAWAAAVANPEVYTSPAPSGGGEYGDTNLSDEFYWAAAELFVTTGKSEYRDQVLNSPVRQGQGIPANGYVWRDVAALGDLSLALLPSRLPPREVAKTRQAIARAADALIDTMDGQGYPVPFRPANDRYYWGSNGQVLNQITILAAAYDVTWDWRYRDAAFEAMDYILGRNGLNQSYVTGYGTKASLNQHHRFWANQADPTLPHPPKGSVAGGPNASLEDPVMAKWLIGCAPQKCYIDDIQSYSTNEVAINWNSALAWVAAWLADHS
ncbi:MAG TPA: glycoside hydrolase family 9 protein [Polyangiaceae bacterium]|nr:glycoside hydrolase family 9 protein [Polyangiaceae bacterium]